MLSLPFSNSIAFASQNRFKLISNVYICTIYPRGCCKEVHFFQKVVTQLLLYNDMRAYIAKLFL